MKPEELKPGRELDALIARHIMEDTDPNASCSHGEYCLKHGTFPHYSTDIAAAWEVVERMGRWKFTLTYEWNFGGGGINPYSYVTAIFDPVITDDREMLMVKADAAPHAICLAALKAIEKKSP